jgi:pantoate--beta-alanine ligase
MSSSSLLIARDRASLQSTIQEWKKQALKIALVPTMGALHEGHLSLIKIALEHADRVAVSIFVNPTQFAPHEDFSAYPRDEKADITKLGSSGAHLVYMPQQDEIYPVIPFSDLKAGSTARGLESDLRPSHFDGVVTVVSRLFKHAGADIAVFGEKDYQQLCVIRQMVTAHDLHIDIIPAPIVRDEEGLALSSRNVYLSPGELKTARKLNKILFETRNEIRTGADTAKILKNATQKLLEAGFNEVQYLELRDTKTLAPYTKPPARLLAAVKVGKTRLIDNVEV